MRVSTALLVASLCACSGRAQTTNSPSARAVTLDQCISDALAHNLDLQIQHRSLDIAAYNLKGAYGAYLPTFSFQARRSYLEQPARVDYNKSGIDYPFNVTTDDFGPALSGRLPFGFDYEFSAVVQDDRAQTFFASNPELAAQFPPRGIRETNSSLANARVTVRQHLLRDFWIDSSRQILLLRRKELKMSEQATLFQIMKTVLAVELGYYDLIAARERIGVQEKALELKRKFLSETTRRVEVGDLPALETEQAETEVQNTLTILAGAREEMVYRQNALKNLLTDNFQELVGVELEPTDTLLAAKVALNRQDSFRRAMTRRPDLAEARLAVERSGVLVKFQLNQLFPAVDLVGRYGGLGIQPDTSTAMSDAIHFRNKEYFYGVVVSIPLGNVTQRNNYAASRQAKQVAELQLKKAEQEILVQVADYINRVESRFAQVGSTSKARAYAESALAAEQKKLERGLSTTFVVLQLQQTLTAAQMAEVDAMAEYNKALAQLAFAEGATMENHHLLLQAR